MLRIFSNNPNRLYLAQCFVFLVALGVVFSLTSPAFLGSSNIGNILAASAVIGLMAIGATFVIASGGIDLSAGSVMAFSGTMAVYAMPFGFDSPFKVAAVAVGTGAVCGFLNGVLINVTRAPSFIVTLGMLSVARAVGFIFTHGVSMYGLPDNIVAMGQGTFLGMPVSVALFVFGAAFGTALLAMTRFGAHALMLGDNPVAAEAMGVATGAMRLKIFTLAGAYYGLAGLVFMLRTNAGDPSAGQGYELIAITAAILGGANLFGGRATIAGTILGVLCLGVLQNGLNLLAVSTYYQILFVGLVLIGAAMMSRAGSRV